MGGATLVAMPHAGEMTLWRLVQAGRPSPCRPAWRRAAAVFGIGLALTAGAAAATWAMLRPDTVVQTRIVADGNAGRGTLSEMALRLTGAPGQPVSLQGSGQALVVTVQGRDPAEAEQRSRSLVDAILDAPTAAPMLYAAPEPVGADAGPRGERDRIAAALAALDAQRAAASAALTTVARDMAAASRTADAKPGHETLDKGNAALADLQLQRLQLASKYQDTYPAVLALDGQIRNLRVFLMDEAQRVQPHPGQAAAADAVLAAERDRLRTELGQSDERRRSLVAQLAALDRAPASTVVRSAAVPVLMAPMLLAAATSNFDAADERPTLIPAVAAAGLLLSGLAALLAARRRVPSASPNLMLEPISPGMLTASPVRSLSSPGFPARLDAAPSRTAVAYHPF